MPYYLASKGWPWDPSTDLARSTEAAQRRTRRRARVGALVRRVGRIVGSQPR